MNYWNRKDEKHIGIVAECQIVGIPAIGQYPPAVLIRHPRTGFAFYYTLKAAASLQWHLAMWVQEQAGKLLNG